MRKKKKKPLLIPIQSGWCRGGARWRAVARAPSHWDHSTAGGHARHQRRPCRDAPATHALHSTPACFSRQTAPGPGPGPGAGAGTGEAGAGEEVFPVPAVGAWARQTWGGKRGG